MKEGAQTLTYHDIRRIWALGGGFPFKQLEVNRYLTDRYPTSWSVQRGHHFFLWKKVSRPDRISLILHPPFSQVTVVNLVGSDSVEETSRIESRAPTASSPGIKVVSTGCFESTFPFSLFGLFRRRRPNSDREVSDVMVVDSSHHLPPE
jgi:hypothetical protein